VSLGSHTAVLLERAVEELKVRADGVYVDCTFGRGGHSRLILSRLGSRGRLIALDRDPDAVKAGGTIGDERFTMLHGAFGRLTELLAKAGIERVDGILLDLGVSSPQLDDPARGFSFRADAPLDMRMDTSQGITAAQWLESAPETEIREVIRNYGEERFAKQIAAAIVAARARGPVGTTRQLAAIVAEAIPTREPRQDPATRTFQAIRIHVNQELEELSLVLPQCVELLAPGGRLVAVSFHSLEDRIVKRTLRRLAANDSLPARLPVKARDIAPPQLKLIGRAQHAAASEIAANPRARSAVMRVAEHIDDARNVGTRSVP
jgi:16S rRNA (cytosine1402-N4)-methyltransferase